MRNKKKKLLGDNVAQTKGGTSLKYIGEGADLGLRLWEPNRQMDYARQLQQVLLLDYGMLQVVFKILQKTIMPFPVLFELVKDNEDISQDTLAQALQSVGITISYALYTVLSGEGTEKQEESEPKREYISAIAPYDLPVCIMYKTISKVLHTNARQRIGGPVAENFDLKGMITDRKTLNNPEQEINTATQDLVGWSRQKKKPAVVGGLWDSGAEEQVNDDYGLPEPVVKKEVVSAPQYKTTKTEEQPANKEPVTKSDSANLSAVGYSGRKKYQPTNIESLW